VLAGGRFTTFRRVPQRFIARLNPDGNLDHVFNPDANGFVRSIAVQSDGNVLIGGQFTTIGVGVGFVRTVATRNFIARLDRITGRADHFDANADGEVSSIAVQADGKVLAGGFFTHIGETSDIGWPPRNLFARLSNRTAALSNVSVTPTTITWTCDGSAPQLTRATFEYSTDNGATYFRLDDATSLDSRYFSTGLTLPTRRNILIRARGYFRSGYLSGSETTTEKVQIAFLQAP
jgi:hypothetical protein